MTKRKEFSDETVEKAWKRAKGICECERVSHKNHKGKNCKQELTYKNRGTEGEGAWEAHHKGDVSDDSLSNCQILCWECHKQTFDVVIPVTIHREI